MGDLLGYARVSTPDQSPKLQTDALQEAGCLRVFVDTQSPSVISPSNALKHGGRPSVMTPKKIAVARQMYTSTEPKHSVTEIFPSNMLSIRQGGLMLSARHLLLVSLWVLLPDLLAAQAIFSDGFESGNTLAWSQTVPSFEVLSGPITGTISAISGGVVELPGFGSVSFPAGSFPSDQVVTLTAVRDISQYAWFLSTSMPYEVSHFLDYFLVLNTGMISVAQTSDGGYVVGGWTTGYSGLLDFLLMKIDAYGDIPGCSAFSSASPFVSTPAPTTGSPTLSTSSRTFSTSIPNPSIGTPSPVANVECSSPQNRLR
jgi:hypothetical protein